VIIDDPYLDRDYTIRELFAIGNIAAGVIVETVTPGAITVRAATD
jgi:hypothetical protein